jgi:hypothetical protein
MILICGIPSESPVNLLLEAAQRKNVSLVLFNQRQAMSAHIELNWKADRNFKIAGKLHVNEGIIPLDQLAGVFNRMMDFQQLPEYKSPGATDEQKKAITGLHLGINEWLELSAARVMNRSSAMASNLSKPYQTQIIQGCGFSVPTTLITNNPQEATRFIKKHRRVIYKSISAVRSIVRELNVLGEEAEFSEIDHKIASGYPSIRWPHPELEKIRYLPTQFQEYIPGENMRVHVVGERIFATKILSQAVDYRYALIDGFDVNMEEIHLDKKIENNCLDLSRKLNLPLCGIDLKVSPHGEWYCFEANPMPAFSYYQEQTGQPIAEAIVEWLQYGQ